MKVRKGFVSNSSTSSFCIYGVCIDNKELVKRTGTDDLWGMTELFTSSGPDYYDEVTYIGASWDGIKDDETGADFRARVQAAIKELLGDDWESFSTYEEAWRDG